MPAGKSPLSTLLSRAYVAVEADFGKGCYFTVLQDGQFTALGNIDTYSDDENFRKNNKNNTKTK